MCFTSKFDQTKITMKKNLLLSLMMMFCIAGFSQIKYEPGYIINKNGEKINCLIKNADWRKSPKEFMYKLSETSEELSGTVQNVKAFFVGGTKYTVFNVDFDNSTEVFNEMTTQKEPQFINETVFLKTILEGKASLYSLNVGDVVRYFFTVDGSNATQFIYKSYKTENGNVAKNTAYKQQLWEKLHYEGMSMNTIENVSYNETSFIPVFNDFNKANNVESVSYKQSGSKGAFHLGIRAGTAIASATALAEQNPGQKIGPLNFGTKPTVRIGISMEMVFPFAHGTWSLFTDPNYQSYKSDIQYNGKAVNLRFNFIEIPIGVRHYFLLNDQSKIFANASYSFGSGTSSLEFNDPNISDAKPSFKGSFSLGAGYKYQGFSAELRYGFKQNIFNNYLYYTSDYHSFSVILGYDIF